MGSGLNAGAFRGGEILAAFLPVCNLRQRPEPREPYHMRMGCQEFHYHKNS